MYIFKNRKIQCLKSYFINLLICSVLRFQELPLFIDMCVILSTIKEKEENYLIYGIKRNIGRDGQSSTEDFTLELSLQCRGTGEEGSLGYWGKKFNSLEMGVVLEWWSMKINSIGILVFHNKWLKMAKNVN